MFDLSLLLIHAEDKSTVKSQLPSVQDDTRITSRYLLLRNGSQCPFQGHFVFNCFSIFPVPPNKPNAVAYDRIICLRPC